MCPTGFEPVANGLKDRCYTIGEKLCVSIKSVSTLGIFTRFTTSSINGINDGKSDANLRLLNLAYFSVVVTEL